MTETTLRIEWQQRSQQVEIASLPTRAQAEKYARTLTGLGATVTFIEGYTEPPAWPDGHFTSVGIPLKGGFFLSRCKCGAERLTPSVHDGWIWSSIHQQEAWASLANKIRIAQTLSFLS